MKPVFSPLPVLAAAILASGCATEGPFPSLAQRDVEREPLGEPLRPTPIVADDSALGNVISELVGRARQSDTNFEGALSRAQSAARAAGGRGSDSWVAAQEQLSRAEATRAGTTRALGDLDRLALERSNLPTSPADQARLSAAMAQVQQLANDQQSRLDQIKTIIGR